MVANVFAIYAHRDEVGSDADDFGEDTAPYGQRHFRAAPHGDSCDICQDIGSNASDRACDQQAIRFNDSLFYTTSDARSAHDAFPSTLDPWSMNESESANHGAKRECYGGHRGTR